MDDIISYTSETYDLVFHAKEKKSFEGLWSSFFSRNFAEIWKLLLTVLAHQQIQLLCRTQLKQAAKLNDCWPLIGDYYWVNLNIHYVVINVILNHQNWWSWTAADCNQFTRNFLFSVDALSVIVFLDPDLCYKRHKISSQ